MTLHPATGLLMLLTLALLVVTTGIPIWLSLIATASIFSLIGCLLGFFDPAVLSAASSRTLGLLEHDLLQALPLYVFVGCLMQRLQIADALYVTLERMSRRTGAGDAIASFGIGALVATKNGSVASSTAMLARLIGPRLGPFHAAKATALICTASTVGVVVPPSMVLLLLGDAMLRAHREASNLPGYGLTGQRIINTHDVFQSALLPATAITLLWLLVAWWQGREQKVHPCSEPVGWLQWFVSAVFTLTVVALLMGVFAGRFFAVEASATLAVLLIAAALASRALRWADWEETLHETMNLSGSLFALLVGATTFSLVFRLWGTGQWIADAILSSSLSGTLTVALVLLLVALCAFVLDAFEMIFVIIPIVAPAMIVRLGDAQQTAVLLLLVLQLSFLVPPTGYAVMMARARSGLARVSNLILFRSLFPYLVAQAAITLAVFTTPWTVHLLDNEATRRVDQSVLSNEEVDRQMRAMSEP